MQGYIPTTQPGKLKVTVLDGHDLEGNALYVILELGTQRHRTPTAKGAGSKVVWNNSFDFRVGMSPELTVMVKSEYSVSFDNELGIADVNIIKAIQNGKHKADVQLMNNANEPKGSIALFLEFEAIAKPKPSIAVPIARDLSTESLYDQSLLDSSYSFDDRWELTSNASRPPLPRHSNSRSLSLERSDSNGHRQRRRSSRHSESSPHRPSSNPGSPHSGKSSKSGNSNGSLRSSSSTKSPHSAFPPKDPRMSLMLSSVTSVSTPRSEIGGRKPDLVPRVERAISERGFPIDRKKKDKRPSSERSFPLTKPATQDKPRSAARVLGVSTPRLTDAAPKVPFGSATPRSFMEPQTPSMRSSTPRSVSGAAPVSVGPTARSMGPAPRSTSARSVSSYNPFTPTSSRSLVKSQSAHVRSSTPRASAATPKASQADLLATAPAELNPSASKSTSSMTKVPPRPRTVLSSRRAMSTIMADTPNAGSRSGSNSSGPTGFARPIWR